MEFIYLSIYFFFDFFHSFFDLTNPELRSLAHWNQRWASGSQWSARVTLKFNNGFLVFHVVKENPEKVNGKTYFELV